jgi:hypothetical protein
LRNHAHLTITVLRRQKDRVPAAKSKQLRGGDASGTISASTAAEHVHCNRRWTSGIEVQTAVHQAAHHKGGVGLIVVDALGDEVEFLAGGAVARLDGDGDEVLAEVAGRRVDEETLSIGGFEGCGGDGAGGGFIAHLGLCDGGGVEKSTGAGNRDLASRSSCNLRLLVCILNGGMRIYLDRWSTGFCNGSASCLGSHF